MLKYLNGLIRSDIIPGEKVLSVTVSDGENGQPLMQNVNLMADIYKKHISCICFIGGEQDCYELAQCCKIVHDYKINAAVIPSVTEISEINKVLTDELDYIKITGRLFKKDYCPFADAEDWIDVTDVQSGCDIRK